MPILTELHKIAEGREAEIFAWEPGTVLKLFRNPAYAAGIDQRMAAMNAVKAAGGPSGGATGRIDIDGRPGMIIERIDGPDLLTRIGDKPWTVWSAGRILGEVHAALHKTPAPQEVPPLRPALTRVFEQNALPHGLGERAAAALAALPDGDRLCHGDFHPGNVILAANRPMVIDWTNCTAGDPAADVARTMLLVRMGALPPGTPAVMRTLNKLGRALLVRSYLRAYRRHLPLDLREVDAWTFPLAVYRLVEGPAEERGGLLGLIARIAPTAATGS